MAVMSIAEAWPAAGRPFTVADLDRMPDDGHRYELLDGALIVSPRPTNPHQEVAMELAVQLRSACPSDLRVIPDPAVRLSATTEFAPDIAVIHRDQINAPKCTVPPLLVVEIRSPSTALIDLGRKKAAYEQFGVPGVLGCGSSREEAVADRLRAGRRVLPPGGPGQRQSAVSRGAAIPRRSDPSL